MIINAIISKEPYMEIFNNRCSCYRILGLKRSLKNTNLEISHILVLITVGKTLNMKTKKSFNKKSCP